MGLIVKKVRATLRLCIIDSRAQIHRPGRSSEHLTRVCSQLKCAGHSESR